ncbi:dTDP-4-dehydrorhamnose 3,5-epimerase family protein [Micromonospora sp. PLK6-60]|uniref:dTDP-4-dehydrorhamnose 3,5-epimerase family protein n=1 Tax=Micromonospora sp. PLK6-60 TaxID=2873383 RepID=UPI001CA7AD04|nr:dTDP-4-dehydrorhamnose 3,5-epimerase family protein [Micromonospora sp. PLK6-60]MBY8874826.1 dTDP-4-dehydrorhamnose 3,5-epimerase family protein [Micromonospora sp. PLK6-60]
MKIRPLSIEGAWEITPQQYGDPRGMFLEWYRGDRLAAAVGHPLRFAQGNLSVSARGVVRGIHFADVPVGQAKYVTCVRGRILDIVVDVRVGSPTYRQWEAIPLDDVDRRAVYLAEGLGHGFCALTEDATLSYLCSTTYDPGTDRAVHPLDPELAIEWPTAAPLLSARDTAAPTLAQARRSGLLPDHQKCQSYAASLNSGGADHRDGR